MKIYKNHNEIDTSVEDMIMGAFDTTDIKLIPIKDINNFVQEFDKEMNRDLSNQTLSEEGYEYE
tara:strand:- start:460 stop:651 length:192 start_codon:yes stop_codon:yes gene_type:complete